MYATNFGSTRANYQTMEKLDETSIINPIDKLPYHHHPEHAQIGVEKSGIPTIDLAPAIISLDNMPANNMMDINDPNILGTIAQIGQACEKWGVFQVVNHGVPLEKLSNLKVAAKKFFNIAKEEKVKICRTMDYPLGYFDDEYTMNVRDSKEAFEFGIPETMLGPINLLNRWPQNPPELRNLAQDSVPQMRRLGMTLVELIALSLGLAVNRLTDSCKEPTLGVRLIKYPTGPPLDPVIGCGAHTDSEMLALISEDDVGGLQVQRKSDEKWIPVKPVPGALVVMLGDIMQVWSNDRYESVSHRVMLNPNKERLSITYFFGPD